MSTPKTIKRLVACFGSIQLITALSVLSYREKEQQNLNVKYENYLVITPLWAPQGQTDEFAAFIEKMAKLLCSWERIVYIPLEQVKSIANKLNSSNWSETFGFVHQLLGITSADEIYLSRNWRFENQLLMNVYESAEKICYGDGIGIYFSQSAFLPPISNKNKSPTSLYYYLKKLYVSFKKKLSFSSQETKLNKQKEIDSIIPQKEFNLGYFSLPCAFGEFPPMKTVSLGREVYLETFERFKRTLGKLIDIDYIIKMRKNIQDVPTSILLTSNFSEASGRMSLENEISAYRKFLETEGIKENSVLLIKPHPRDSKLKILELKSTLGDLYSDIFLLNDSILFYLPFEVFFMEVFFNSETQKNQFPRIFTFSSACLTLEFLFNAQCTIGFGSNIVEESFYEAHVADRIKHEADLLSAIQEIRNLNASLKTAV